MEEKTKFELQNRLIDFLNIVTKPDPKIKNHFICPFCGSGNGKHHTGALSVATYKGIPRAKCFAQDCVNGADIFDICGKLEGLNTFPKQAKKVMEILNYNEYTEQKNKPEKEKGVITSQITDPNYNTQNGYADFYAQNRYDCSQIDYLQKRGISEEVIKFEHIGYCPNWQHPRSAKMKKKEGIIIPISKNSYVFRDIKCPVKEYRYFRVNQKETNSPFDRFFGFDYLTSSENIFIVEGEIDALSVLTTGNTAVALGSTANATEFIEAIEKINKVPRLILFLDNDETGIETTKNLINSFKKINLARKKADLMAAIEVSTINYTNLGYDTVEADPNQLLQEIGIDKFKEFLLNATTNFCNEIIINDVSSDEVHKYSLNIKQYLAEYESPILQLLRDNKKSLLVAPMGTGKTRLIKSIEKIIDPFSVLVIVNPSTKHLLQMQKDYNIHAVCAGSEYMGQNIVCVTPESLKKKVINKLQRPFTLIVDEAHSIYSDFNFRKSFADVKEVEKMAEKVIYMTATPDILYETENFNCIIEVDKENQTKIATEIIETEKLNAENIVALMKDLLQKGTEFIALHNDDKKENETICKVLNEQLELQTMIDPHFQENLFGFEPRIESHIKNTAVTVDASQKDSKIFETLINDSTIDENVKIFCTTSCIQAGININNTKDTVIVYVCNDDSFRCVNFLQSTGRYRNREKIKKIILVKNKLDKTEYPFRKFQTCYEENTEKAKDIKNIVNYLHNKYKERELEEDLAKKAGLIFDEIKQEYDIDDVALKANAYKDYNKGLLYHPETLKKKLEQEKATALKVSIIQIEEKTDQETKELLQETKKNIKALFDKTLNEMLKCDEKTLNDILTYNVDKRKIENVPLIDIMENYHKTASTTFKETLKKVIQIKNLEIVQAFQYITKFETLKAVDENLNQERVLALNRDINEKGENLAFENYNKHSPFVKKVVFIRYMLQALEKKRGYVGTKTINKLADEMLKAKIYNKKMERKKIISDVEKLLKYIYNFDSKSQMSSIKT